MKRILVAIAGFLVAAAIVGPRLVFGHAEYDYSVPAAGSQVPTAPTQVDVYFTEDLLAAPSTHLNVVNSSNANVDNNNSTIDPSDHSHMYITLQPALPNGLYTVEWASTSEDDGDTDEGEFTFRIGPPPVGGVSTDPISSDSGGIPTGTIAAAIAIALAVALAGGGALSIRRRIQG